LVGLLGGLKKNKKVFTKGRASKISYEGDDSGEVQNVINTTGIRAGAFGHEGELYITKY